MEDEAGQDDAHELERRFQEFLDRLPVSFCQLHTKDLETLKKQVEAILLLRPVDKSIADKVIITYYSLNIHLFVTLIISLLHRYENGPFHMVLKTRHASDQSQRSQHVEEGEELECLIAVTVHQ